MLSVEVPKKERTNNVANFLFYNNADDMEDWVSEACHYSVWSNRDFDYVASEYRSFTDEVRCYYDYLISRSVFAPVFLNKSVDCVEKNYFRVDLNEDANLVMGGLIATRQPWEYPKVIEVFNKLIDSGVEEDRAFLFSFLLIYNKDSYKIAMHNSGHSPVCVSTKEYVRNFLDRKHKPTGSAKSGDYKKGVFDTFGKYDYGINNEVVECAKKIKVKEEDNLNIFNIKLESVIPEHLIKIFIDKLVSICYKEKK